MGTPQITIETITPEMAAELLARSDLSNRRIRPATVQRYMNDMVAGRWQLTGEPIIVNGTTLINGHHRLNACIQGGMPFTTAVFRGADRQVYSVVDSGLPRQAGDVLEQDGHQNATVLGATVRLVLGYRSSTLNDNERLSLCATRQAMQAEAARARDLYEACVSTGKRARGDGYNPSAFAAFLVLLSEDHVGLDAALEYADPMISGAGLEAGDPRLALIRWLKSARKMKNVNHLAVYIRNRNAAIRGETRLVVQPWLKGQTFPVLEG